jgi:hypothetical protein
MQIWEPKEAGDSITGTVALIEAKKMHNGTPFNFYTLLVDGQRIGVPAAAVMLAKGLNGCHVGDTAECEYLGEEWSASSGRMYKKYRVVVARPEIGRGGETIAETKRDLYAVQERDQAARRLPRTQALTILATNADGGLAEACSKIGQYRDSPLLCPLDHDWLQAGRPFSVPAGTFGRQGSYEMPWGAAAVPLACGPDTPLACDCETTHGVDNVCPSADKAEELGLPCGAHYFLLAIVGHKGSTDWGLYQVDRDTLVALALEPRAR